MKKTIFLFSTLVFLLEGCVKWERNYEDYFPQLTVIAEAQSDGSVLLTATIEEWGTLNTTGVGFAFSESENFGIDENQLLATNQIEDNIFTALYSKNNFDPLKTYYFKSWAITDAIYSTSSVCSLDNVEAIPIDGPCTYPDNYFFMLNSAENVYSVDPWYNDFYVNSIVANASNTRITFTFNSAFGLPNTGIYTTTNDDVPDNDFVKVKLDRLGGSTFIRTLEPGQNVYINRTSPTSWTIEYCSAEWVFNSTTTLESSAYITF